MIRIVTRTAEIVLQRTPIAMLLPPPAYRPQDGVDALEAAIAASQVGLIEIDRQQVASLLAGVCRLLDQATYPDGAMTPSGQVRLSWCDDGITLLCERGECMEVIDGGSFWYQRVLDITLPAQAQAALDAHVATHTPEGNAPQVPVEPPPVTVVQTADVPGEEPVEAETVEGEN